MLVAVAVMMVLMAGFTMLFTGSVRTVRTAMQQTDAYDRAGGALSAIKLDLLTAFNGRATGNSFSFYGTPIGMTFVGLVKNMSEYADGDLGQADLHLARITYVLYHASNEENDALYKARDPELTNQLPPIDMFEESLEQINAPAYATAYVYPMLRYVEPNVGDLDSFPYSLGAPAAPTQPEGTTINDILDGAWENYTGQLEAAGFNGDLSAIEEDFYRAKKREIWIRMLAGGDKVVPNAWTAPAMYMGWSAGDCPLPHEYVITGNIATAMPPFEIDGVFGYDTNPFAGAWLFDYKYAGPGDNPGTGWWNQRPSDWAPLGSPNCSIMLGDPGFDTSYCKDTCLPEIVTANIMLMFKAPYPSAPDFQKVFPMQVNIPAGYTRQVIISGWVHNELDAAVGNVTMQVLPDPDPSSEVKTDVTGYYSVVVPSGWSGRIRPGGKQPVDDDCDDCVAFREYTNVTTSIENQNYAVQ